MNLYRAVENDDVAEARRLLQLGADVNYRASSGGTTSLQLAVYRGNGAMTKLLLEHGADIEAVDYAGLTALQAAIAGNLKGGVVQILLESGANSDVTDPTGVPIFSYLMDNKHDPQPSEQLILETAKVLTRFGVSSSRPRESDGRTPLMFAALRGRLPTVKYLVEELGQSIEKRNLAGYTALPHAAFRNHLNVFEYLIAQGADVKATANDGSTSLHEICFNANGTKIAEILLDSGLDANARRTTDGWTPLHVAAKEAEGAEAVALVTTLIEGGADVALRTYNGGETAKQIAEKHDNFYVEIYLEGLN